MSDPLGMDVLLSLLDRLPGVFWAARADMTTGKTEWIHIGSRMAEMYGVTVDEIRDDANAIMKHIVPEDRARLDQAIAESMQTLAPLEWSGRLLRDGQLRWIETHTKIDRRPDGSLLWWGQAYDVTERRLLENELRTRNEQLAASEEVKAELIDRLRRAVDELSNPILEVWDGVLAMPIIGLVDSRRTADMVQRLLAEVLRMQASFVIIDLTGVDVVDTKTADHLIKLMKKVEVVGARCVLTGIRPAVAETLVDIGVDFGRLATLRNLKHGLGEALRLAKRERETWRELAADEEASDEPRRRSLA